MPFYTPLSDLKNGCSETKTKNDTIMNGFLIVNISAMCGL